MVTPDWSDAGSRSFVARVGPFELLVEHSRESGWRAEAHYISTIRRAPEPLATSDQAKTVAVELASTWIDEWCNELYELVPRATLH